MHKNIKKGLRRAINKFNKRAYQKDHRPRYTHRRKAYTQCWAEHDERSFDCRLCKKFRYYKSNEWSLDIEYKEYFKYDS